jgi:hypothetical protein
MALFKRQADTRPDPEDKDAYAHCDKVISAQTALDSPVQVRRGDTAGWTKLDVPQPPVGYDSWVDIYEGPKGKGFQVTYEAKRSGTPFRKVVNVGPEAYREMDWTEMKQPPVMLPPGVVR